MLDHILNLIRAFDFLISPLVSAVMGGVAVVVGRRLPHRMLWRFTDPGSVTYCVATSGHLDTGAYLRPMTGVGQVRAFALISPSISQGYPGLQAFSILLSQNIPPSSLAKDLVLLGAAKTNAITREVTELLFPRTKFRFVGDLDTLEFDGETISSVLQSNKNETDRGQIIKTYSVVICAENPYAEDRRLVILAGIHTYGTEGAAKLFVEKLKRRAWRLPKCYIAFAETNLRSEEILNIRILKIRRI